MSAAADLLIELGTEELPPKALLGLSTHFHQEILRGLADAGITHGVSRAFATPRRLAVLIDAVPARQPDQKLERRGPALAAAYDKQGAPSGAALGFARSCGVDFAALERLETDKGAWLVFRSEAAGQTIDALIPGIVERALAALPIPKRMRWGSFTTEFVRPVHWAVLLFGDSVIKTEILGLQTGATTQGHRFHAPQKITLNKPEDYAQTLLQQGRVIAEIEQRKTIIRDAAQQAAAAVKGFAHIEDDLLDEIAALNEWPVPITGTFDTRYLALPPEVLITTMQTNQKYFPVKNANGDLLANFITFSNIESTNPISIQQGNERVVTPRLSDAEFFWNQDRKKTLEDRVESLSSVVFQENLGTVFAKTKRVQNLAKFIAGHLGANVELAERAALLAKADLMTEMVGEFGNLQGLMGRYYALADNEPKEVAYAIEEHYFPKQSGSPTAGSATGQVLAIAEKIDTLVGIFAVGLIPTGDKDPYALRRAALGILRTIIENKLNINIVELIVLSKNIQCYHKVLITNINNRLVIDKTI